MVSTECLLRKNGFRFTFLGCVNDGLSCNSIFMFSVLTDFLRGEINYTTYTNKTIILSHPGINMLLEPTMLKLLASISLLVVY